MKKRIIFFILSILVISISNNSFAGKIAKSVVPKAIITSFEKEYPKAKKVHYVKENEGGKSIFQIDFIMDNKELEALYNLDGTMIQLEEELKTKDIPADLLKAIKEEYPKSKVLEASKIYKNGKFSGYSVEIKTGGNSIEIEFDSSNKIIKKN